MLLFGFGMDQFVLFSFELSWYVIRMCKNIFKDKLNSKKNYIYIWTPWETCSAALIPLEYDSEYHVCYV